MIFMVANSFRLNIYREVILSGRHNLWSDYAKVGEEFPK